MRRARASRGAGVKPGRGESRRPVRGERSEAGEGSASCPPGSGRAPSVRVLRPCRCRLCRAARRERAGPFPVGSRPARAAHCLVRVSRPRRCRLCRAARGREQGHGASPPGHAQLGPRTALRVCRGHKRCRPCRAARGRAQGPSPPGLTRLGPRTALCVSRGHDAVGCAEQRKGGSRAPPRRVSPGSGRAPPCACVAAMTLLVVPSSEGEGAGSLPAGSHPARAAHRLARVSRP